MPGKSYSDASIRILNFTARCGDGPPACQTGSVLWATHPGGSKSPDTNPDV